MLRTILNFALLFSITFSFYQFAYVKNDYSIVVQETPPEVPDYDRLSIYLNDEEMKLEKETYKKNYLYWLEHRKGPKEVVVSEGKLINNGISVPIFAVSLIIIIFVNREMFKITKLNDSICKE